HLVHSASDHFADLWVTGRHGSNLRNLSRRVNRGRTCLELFHCLFCSSRDTAVELNRVGTRSNVTQTFKNQGLCQKRSRRGAVTSVVVGLRSEEHTSALRHSSISYAFFLLKKNKK